MKIKDVKHNHSLTDLLKVGIFSILMLAPMINVGVRSAYVICNKNAYQSYSGQSDTQLNYYTSKEQIPLNQTIYSYLSYGMQFYNTGYLPVSEINIIDTNTGLTENDLTNMYYLRIYSSRQVAFFTQDLTTNIYKSLSGTNYINLSYKLNAYNELNEVGTMFGYINNASYSYVDNVFEYSVNQLTESPLYNWVENTAIYSGVALMNTQLGITQPVISLMVVYWLLLTIIYIIIDIIIRVFTWLTHMIGSKTA